MRYIGIDYGSRRIGVAYSDEAGTIAMPVEVIPADAQALERILAIYKERAADAVVLGESKDLGGKDNKIMKSILAFKEVVEKEGIPVHFEREFFTSTHVEDKGALHDASAAALILQRYLDRKNHQNK